MKSRFLHLMLAAALLPLSTRAVASTLEVTVDGISYQETSSYGGGLEVTGSSLSALNIPEKVTVNDTVYDVVSIASQAFSRSSSLYDVSVPSSVKNIGESAFYNSKVINVTLADGIEVIGSYAFGSCSFLTEITLPSTLKAQESAQFKASGLVKVTFRDGVTDIPNYFFNGCESLTEVNLPSTLRTLGNYVFNGCKGLVSLDMPDGLLSIGQGAFYNCVSLKKVKLPDTLLELGVSAFYGCSALASIDLPPLLTEIYDSTFYNCTSLESVNLPSNALTIGGHALYGCSMLKAVSIPEKVQTIGPWAFQGCTSLEEVYIPMSVSSFGSRVFDGCSKLTKVHARFRNPKSLGSDVFVPSTKPDSVTYTLYVPVGTVDAYKAIDTYADFDVIEEESIGLSMESKRTLIVGNTAKLDVNPVPSVYPLGSITWESSNKAAATVDSYGNVTAVAPGSATITATTNAEGADVTARCAVEVIDEPTISFVVQQATLSVGSVAALPIEMVNESEIVAFQCDIYLPEGMDFAKDSDGEYDFSYAGRESRSHVLESRRQTDGAVRVVGYSTSNAAFKDNQGTLFYIPLSLPSVMGDYTIRISNILVTEKSLTEMPLVDVESTVYVGTALGGDANGDGRITISDAAVTSAYILGEVTDGFNFTNADVVADGVITLADVSEIVNRVLGGETYSVARKVASRANGVDFPTREGDLMSVEDIDINPGEEKAVTVSFSNVEDFTSFCTEIILPDGLRFQEEDGECFIDLDDARKTRSHTSACRLQEDGRLRALAYSSTNALFKGNEGPLFTFYIVADVDFDNTKPCKIRMENNYICNRNEDGVFTDYDVNDCESTVNSNNEVDAVSSVEGECWNVFVRDNVLVIDAPDSATVSLVTVDGLSTPVAVQAGRNTIAGLAPGLYIVKGVKVVIR